MPAIFFVLLSNWPVFPIALMDVIGVAVGAALWWRRRDWPPLLATAAFGVRALSSLTRLAFYVASYYTSGAPAAYAYPYGGYYDPVTDAVFHQTMNCVVAAGGVATLAALQAALWFGLTRPPKAASGE